MDGQMLLVWTGVIIILVGISLPALCIAWMFLRDLLKLLKEIIGDTGELLDKAHIEFIAEHLQDELTKQEQIEEKGFSGYYGGKLKAGWETISFFLYAGGILLVLFMLPLRRHLAAAVVLIKQLNFQPGVLLLITVLEAVFLLIYVLCKTHRHKWKSAIALVALVALKQIWNLAHGVIEASVDQALFLMLFLAVYHYKQWKRQFSENTKRLHNQLMESRFGDDEIVQLYEAVLHHRKETGERQNFFRTMRDDDEVSEMLRYLNWLEQSEENPAEDEELQKEQT